MTVAADPRDAQPVARPGCPAPGRRGPRCRVDLVVDVAVVGAGYTGLWTAYHLARADPSLRVAVLEREVAGFGASGRNGGWCSALFPTSWARLAQDVGRDGAVAMQRALEDTVRRVGDDAAAEGIDCDYARGGMLGLARGPAQLARAREHVAAARAFGLGPDTLDLLGAEAARARVGATRVHGALTTEHCAALDPARLVRGLAEAVERRGVQVYEQTRGDGRGARAGHDRARARCARSTCWSPRRATRRSCPAAAATWRRSTR